MVSRMPRRRRSRTTASHRRRPRRLTFEPLEARALLSLTHLYTFNDGTANDWIGNSHGTLRNGAAVVNGQLRLANTSVTSGQSTTVQHVSLPANLLPSGDVTLEVWYTASDAAIASRVFDIGNQTGAVGDSYLYFTPHSATPDSRAVLRPSASTELVASGATTDDGLQHMAALVIDASAGLLRLYVDGAAAGTASLGGADAGSINDSLAYLGRSLFNVDPGFTGSINELRIYDEAVSAGQIGSHAAAGPTTSLLAGDYNADQIVDAADYVTWRKSGSTLGYVAWRSNFGRVAQPSPTLDLNNKSGTYASLVNTSVVMTGHSELHVTGGTNPISGSIIHLYSDDAWLFLPNIAPSVVTSTYLSQIRVNGAAAVVGTNVRVVQYGEGAVVIPHGANFAPLQVFSGPSFTGTAMSLTSYTAYNNTSLAALADNITSFKLKRGYTATIAQNADGTGVSRNYVAQDGDIEVALLPNELNNSVSFVRIFPWRWVTKKGASDNSATELNATWRYNWDINQNSGQDWEYVAIRQQPFWPSLNQNWQSRQINHLLGFNEPDNPVEDAYQNLSPPGSVSDAVARWPELLATGLRVGAPAVTDGGTSWIVNFVNQADAAGYRVDYVPVHYYRGYSNNDDPQGAANQLYNFLKNIYDQVQRPLWVTEFNNGANWTSTPDPNVTQNRNVIEAMINMMDNTPWIERYAIYSRVEWVRQTHYDEGGLTPMGTMYRDHVAPIAYQQVVPEVPTPAAATYRFDGDLDDESGYGHSAILHGTPSFATGQNGQALVLSGNSANDDYVRLSPRLGDSTDFTFGAWVKWNGGANWQRIFDLGLGTSNYMFLTPSSGSGTLRFAIRDGGSDQQLNSTALPINTWTHVAVTISGNTGKLFVNGQLVNTNTSMTINPVDIGTTSNYLGKSQFSADPLFGGQLDDVQFLPYALTDAQVASMLTNAPPQFALGPITAAPGTQGVAYSGTIAGTATDANGHAITYAKVVGPAWLTVAANGTLSGTPPQTVSGLQEFLVSATDAAGATVMTVLNIQLPNIFVNGIWTSLASGNWGTVTNWSANTPANGIGATADFSTLNITSDLTVTLDQSRTIGSLKFGDTSGGQNWTLAAAAGSTLTLEAEASTVTVNQNTATISAVLAGSNGLVKDGAGTLVLSGGNTYSGVTTLSSGTLGIGNNAAFGNSTLDLRGAALQSSNATARTIGNAIIYSADTTFGGAGELLFTGPVNAGSLSKTFTVNNTRTEFSGVISGSGARNISGSGTLVFSGTNTYSGSTSIGVGQGAGVLRASANNALGTGEATIGPAGNSTTARLELSNNATIPNLIWLSGRNNSTVAIQNIGGNNTLAGTINVQVGGSTYLIQSDAGTLNLNGTLTSVATGARTVTLGGNDNGNIGGTVQNGSATMNIVKAGAGTWTLAGNNTYTGTTTVSAGILQIGSNERIANTSGLVMNGGTLSTGGFSETMGALSLMANSTIDFGSGVSTLTHSGAGTFTAGRTLTITNWTSGSDRLFIGSTASLSAAQLAQINFDGVAAQQLSTGEVVPVAGGSALAALATTDSIGGPGQNRSGLGAVDGNQQLSAVDQGFEDLLFTLQPATDDEAGSRNGGTSANDFEPADPLADFDDPSLDTSLSLAFAGSSFTSVWRSL